MNMTIHTDAIGLTALILVVLAWVAFALIFLVRKKPPRREEVKRSNQAVAGIILQGVSFGLVWTLRREYWWPFPPSVAGETALAAVAVVVAWGSSRWCLRALQTLGMQWTVAARVIAGHELITEGPYRVVRNPIYLGMFGVMIATGLVLSTWWALLAAIAVFLIGNQIRIKEEERLLRETFGAHFEEYARRVPAFVPRFW
jgi:protein-S-isoprenylcysteine O-methyltransferase Ste14